MTKPLRLYGWELDNPTPEDISPVYTDTATLSRGLPLYDNTGEIIPQSWVGDIDTTNNTFNLMEKTEYITYNREVIDRTSTLVTRYLYEIVLGGNEYHWYIKENDNYIEITNNVTVNKKASFAVKPARRKSGSNYSYYFLHNLVLTPTISSNFMGYPYNVTSGIYLKTIPAAYGLNTFSSRAFVSAGDDTSSLTVDYVDTSTSSDFPYITYLNLNSRILIYNNQEYELYIRGTKYKAFVGIQTGTTYYVEYVMNEDTRYWYYAYSNQSVNNSPHYTIYFCYDPAEELGYVYYNSADSMSSYYWESCSRAPSLDTDTLPW